MTPATSHRRVAAIAVAIWLVCVAGPTRSSAQPERPEADRIVVHRSRLEPSILRYRRSLSKGVPGLRGFRAPILEQAASFRPTEPPGTSAPAELQDAADIVARALARDGLLATAARAIERLGCERFIDAGEDEVNLLQAIGLPVDLLACFSPPEGLHGDPEAIIRYLGRRLAAGQTADTLRPELGAIPFLFTQTRADFHVATESGDHDIGTLRLQLPASGFWRGPGDGACVDIARQLVEKLPDVSFLVSIEERHAEAFLSLARQWPLRRPAQFRLLAEPMPVAQWAQDNGKPGIVGSEQSGTRQIATLVPRYAGRGEECSIFVPDETFVLDGLAAVGHLVLHSPLLFQGGNLIPVREPATGERILLIGEAEICRNTALGLTRSQVIEAFRIEFGVDRCVVLPAVSFHIDSELCVRAHEGHLVAFVNDTMAAVRIILSLGLDALDAHGTLDAATARAAREDLEAGRDAEFMRRVGGPVMAHANRNGYFPESLARFFGTSPVDAPAGNFQRFLLAMDKLAVTVMSPDDLPDDRLLRGFARALRSQEKDRSALHQQLRQLGWEVVGVPSIAAADRSINYLNGIHDRTRYVMPAYGGFYEPLDRAAAKVFADKLGTKVQVIPVLCGASQRSFGAVHCSTSAYPRP